jgi:hypothetical protein
VPDIGEKQILLAEFTILLAKIKLYCELEIFRDFFQLRAATSSLSMSLLKKIHILAN